MTPFRFLVARLVLPCVLAVPSLAVTAAQQPGAASPDPFAGAGVERSSPSVVPLTVAMLSSHIGSIAGLPVQVVEGTVERVLSPRMFVVAHRGPRFAHDRVAVLLERGEAILPDAAAIVVYGTARTPLGARLTARRPPDSPFTDQELDAIGDLAVVVAVDVTTPGGVSLVRQ